jgi:hypothetical protein
MPLGGVNYNKKGFVKLTPVANFINHFWHNYCYYRHIALSFDLGYAARGVNYAIKGLMKLASVANFIKHFWNN